METDPNDSQLTKKRVYTNPWIPQEALRILREEGGSILDVGGGEAPYYRAAHVIDCLPYDTDRLDHNAWGVASDSASGSFGWAESQYTQFDLCAGVKWPYADNQFDLGLCSHCLEDLREPLQVVKELGRCCKKVLIVCPSRLFEQMRGVDHPRFSGMHHHLWLVREESGALVFRRKTPTVELPGAHLRCPPGKKLKREAGCMYYYGEPPVAVTRMFWEIEDDLAEYRRFVAEHREFHLDLEPDSRCQSWRYWVWYFKQRLLGVA